MECSLSSSSPPRITAAFETYFSTPPRRSEGGIKVLPWRGGVNAEGWGVKDGGAAILAGVSSSRLSETEVIPTQRRVL